MYNKTRRHFTTFLIIFLCAAVLWGPRSEAGSEPHIELPVFLNGESVYTQTGDASLLSVAADAARKATSADIAVLPARCAGGSLEAGLVNTEQIRQALPGSEELITVSISPGQLAQLINEISGYGQEMFPHISGVQVWAERILDREGEYKGKVYRVERSGDILASMPVHEHAAYSDQYSSADITLTLATTRSMCESISWLAVRSEDTGISVSDAFIEYLQTASSQDISSDAQMPRFLIVSDVIDTPLAIEKLKLDVPSAVTVNLARPTTIADTIMYELTGQDRDLICRVFGGDIPYSLLFRGAQISTPDNVRTAATVSQTVPHGRKTANTFDSGTIFVDLRENDTIPPGTSISVCVEAAYDPGTVLYVYRYHENGDIGALISNAETDDYGCISFPVESDQTYVINSRALDSASFELPSAAHPYTLGIAGLCAAYALWFVLFLVRKHRRRPA